MDGQKESTPEQGVEPANDAAYIEASKQVQALYSDLPREAVDDAIFDEQMEQSELAGEFVAAPESTWYEELATNGPLLYVLAWVAFLVAMTEFLKPWIKRLVTDADLAITVIRGIPTVFGVASGWYIAPMIASELGWFIKPWEASVFGGPTIGLLAIGAYEIFRETKPIQVIKVRFHRLAGVTDSDIEDTEP